MKDAMGENVQYMKWDLRFAWYYAVIGGLLAIVPAYWAPFHFPYLVSAAVIGGVGIALKWLLVRRWKSSSILVIFLVVIAAHEVRPWLLPSHDSLCEWQFLGVFIFTIGVLQIVLLKRLARATETQVA